MTTPTDAGTSVTIQPGQVVESPLLPERVEIVKVTPLGPMTQIHGFGLRTRAAIQRYLNAEQLMTLKVVGGSRPDYRGDPLKFRLGIEAIRLALAYEYDPYFSLSIAKVDPLPHQLEAVYDYFLKLPRIRFLLADDAGAGKTIMAGLLLKELKLRGLIGNVLVVAPANLGFQWQREMFDRFGERFDILRGIDLQNAYGTNPWQDRKQVITSIDWAKREDVVESLGRAHWDLIFVDEAHRMSASSAEHKTQRYRLGEMLSDHCHHMVMLTATPHKGDPENFCLFLQLLDKDVYGNVASLEEAMRRQSAPFYLRRTKEAMKTFPDPQTGKVSPVFKNRTVETAPFDLQPEEFEFYQALTAYIRDQSMKVANDTSARARAIGFTMAMYQRRFASSLHAVVKSLERRRKKLHDQLTKAPVQVAVPGYDQEDLDELDEQQLEELVERIEAATIPIDRAAVAAEIQAIDDLLKQGRSLEEREVSSKLIALRDLLERTRVLEDEQTKLLIFTEHKDTLDWLVERLQGWGLKVTQIHGSMKVGDRDTEGTRLYAERAFRDEAQVMVATEAAGEGINLQFCWLMINFDIPWNPVRLEQRMGRIHRYGQEHDCLIFNFVAINTFEGRVLGKLLERLAEIRRELGTDQVFDVVGEVLSGNQVERLVRDHYAGRRSEAAVLAQIEEDADPERFRRITQSALESLARKSLNLASMVGRLAEAKERRLVPEVVEAFFLAAAPLHEIHPQPSGVAFRIGRLPRSVQAIGAQLEPRFGRLGREYRAVVFDKERLKQVQTAEWVTPGHPLFEAVRELTERAAENDRRRGATFYEVDRTEPARLEIFSVAIKDGLDHPIHRRLWVVEVLASGELRLRQPTLFLDLIDAAGATVPELPTPPDGALEGFVIEQAGLPLLADVDADRRQQIDSVRRHVEISLNALIDQQQNRLFTLAAATERGEDVARFEQLTEQQLEELNRRLTHRLRELDSEKELTLADVQRLGGAVVLPHPSGERGRRMVSDPEIEAIAMEAVMRYERVRNFVPADVSDENRGYDILSAKEEEDGAETRFIEVKGRVGRAEVALSPNEFRTAQRLRADYWLYVVYDCGKDTPAVIPIQDPARLDPEPIEVISHYRVTREKVEAAAGA